MRPSSSGSGPFRSSIWRRSTSPPQGRWLRNGSRASTRCERVRALACVIACVIACEMGAVLRSAVRGCAPSPLPEVARLERVYDVPLSEVALSATCVPVPPVYETDGREDSHCAALPWPLAPSPQSGDSQRWRCAPFRLRAIGGRRRRRSPSSRTMRNCRHGVPPRRQPPRRALPRRRSARTRTVATAR